MPLAFDRSFEVHYGETVVVAPLVRRVTARNPGPFTFKGTNTFLIGTDDLALIDPGPDDADHLAAVLAGVGLAKVEAILVTHSHRDHAPGARRLAEATGAPVLAAGIDSLAAPLAAGPVVRLDASADGGFAPDRRIIDGEVIGGRTFRLEAVATPGHASDHLAFALRGTDILFSGDHVMGWATTVVAPPDGSMTDYLHSLDKLLTRPETTYFPAHGGPIRNAHAFVRGLRTHRRMRERAILDRLRKGDRSVAEIVAHIYADVDPRLHGAAALSTFAHLEDLIRRKLVLTSGVPRIDGCYWSIGRGGGTLPEPGDCGEGPAGSASAIP